MLDLGRLDIDEIAMALSDQTDYEHRWLLDPRTGQVAFWTSDTGIDGQNPVELDELDLIPIDPLPSGVWYQDMADFADAVSDNNAGRRLRRAIAGRERSAGSRTSCTWSIRIWCRRGTPSVTREPNVEPSNGCWTKDSSTTTRPASS
jgi:hypothetical protein